MEFRPESSEKKKKRRNGEISFDCHNLDHKENEHTYIHTYIHIYIYMIIHLLASAS